MSLVLRPGNRKGDGHAAQINVKQREPSDLDSDDGWDKIDGIDCC